MNLTEEEARRIFPDDRGESVDDADIESYLRLDRIPHGWRVTSGSQEWVVPRTSLDRVLGLIEERLDVDDPVVWDLFVDIYTSKEILNRITDRNP